MNPPLDPRLGAALTDLRATLERSPLPATRALQAPELQEGAS